MFRSSLYALYMIARTGKSEQRKTRGNFTIPLMCFRTSEIVTFLTITNILQMFCFLSTSKEFVLKIRNYILSSHFVTFKSDTGQVMRGDMGVSHYILLNWMAELYHKLQVPER